MIMPRNQQLDKKTQMGCICGSEYKEPFFREMKKQALDDV
jgi:hypothetical protein